MKKKTGHGGPGLDSSYPLGLALSGGGHRAALFGLGVLMALRDAGRQLVQISSVSGGSITNAFLAYHYFHNACQLKEHDREAAWEGSTRLLFDTIVNKGALTRPWIGGLAALLVVPPLAVVVLALGGWLPAYTSMLPALAVWLTIVLLRGLLIEWLIAARYFPGSRGAVVLKSLQNPVEHVICCTDLVSGRPVYVSTRDGGLLFRRTRDPAEGGSPRTLAPLVEARESRRSLGLSYQAESLPVALMVRASAGFPGIPPRRLRLTTLGRCLDDGAEAQRLPRFLFLSDGGIWNNLATQPFEDRFLWGDYGPWVIVVADASAPLGFTPPAPLHVPGWAEIRALVRQAVIQNANTVGPRRAVFQEGIRRELLFPRDTRFKAERLYPVVSCQETPNDVVARLAASVERTYDDDFLVESERQRREERRSEVQSRANALREKPEFRELCQMAQIEQPSSDATRLSRGGRLVSGSLGSLLPPGGDVGPATLDSVAGYPTTLGKVDRTTALALVGRGYANTAVMLYLTLLADRLVVPDGWLGERLREAPS